MSLDEKDSLAMDVLEACIAAIDTIGSEPIGSRSRNRASSRLLAMIDAAMSGDEGRQRATLSKLREP